METKSSDQRKSQLQDWSKKQTALGVKAIHETGAIDSLVTEARAAWILPYQMLIGKLRPQGRNDEFIWFIYGAIKTDYIDGKVAQSPREAAKHFAMKWQLEAARSPQTVNPEDTQPINDDVHNPDNKQLAIQAEALYELTEDDRVWAS